MIIFDWGLCNVCVFNYRYKMEIRESVQSIKKGYVRIT